MSHSISRRVFLGTAATAATCSLLRTDSSAGAQSATETGFFTLAQRNSRWWFITPEGEPFFSIGLNHIDPSPLRYEANGDLWERKYGNSIQQWLKESVAPDLRGWGFNSVGWTQEVVTRGLTNHRHSRAFTFEEYQWLGLPYCHQLPFADFHQWDAEVRHPDLSSPEFAQWCDYVAREYCARMKDDSKLIGYFYIDCPTWIHTRDENTWKGPLFDPTRLETEAGRKTLFDLATQYYRITHDAIRRYDKNHLILGDRYEAARPVADEVVEAAMPYVDVLSFQHFSTPEKVSENLDHWYRKTGKPVLLADNAVSIKQPDGGQRHNGEAYAETLSRLRELEGCVGYHLCGAYLRNECRRRGLRDASEQPDDAALSAITAANREAAEWMRRAR